MSYLSFFFFRSLLSLENWSWHVHLWPLSCQLSLTITLSFKKHFLHLISRTPLLHLLILLFPFHLPNSFDLSMLETPPASSLESFCSLGNLIQFHFKYNPYINNPKIISPSLVTPWISDQLTHCLVCSCAWIPHRHFKPNLSKTELFWFLPSLRPLPS